MYIFIISYCDSNSMWLITFEQFQPSTYFSYLLFAINSDLRVYKVLFAEPLQLLAAKWVFIFVKYDSCTCLPTRKVPPQKNP